ncbi:matrilysin-like [Porites lutea]|uniref:matrilysin-like n=1 Tax=Porites lutea TaxID=51062 RepID=UPI003CC5BA91
MKVLCVVSLWALLCSIGNCEDDQTIALKFLNDFGYVSFSRSGNHDVSTAIRMFQEYFGLRVSGILDASTVNLMKKPRCGVPDANEGVRMQRYATLGKWSKKNLNYFVQPGQDLPHDQQRKVFGDALQFWADVSGLTFNEVSTARNADIKISFGRYSHNGTTVEGTCPYPFNGPGGVLAHAYYPQDGRAHFDEDETFTHNTSSGTNLLWVAVHEFGHSLGLRHSNVRGAVMYPYYTGYVPDMKLHSDDVAGIQSLYGPNTEGGGEVHTLTPSQASTPVPPTTEGPGNCNDRTSSSDCHGWKEAGFCNNPDHMSSLIYWCPKTCYNCPSPEGEGREQTSTPTQTTDSPPSTTTSSETCYDLSSSSKCQGWKEAGFCTHPDHEEALKHWCPKTCYNCNEKFTD